MTKVPLSPLDELYLNLDRSKEPWTVHYEVALTMRLDLERLVDAIAAAAARHPLARARLAGWRLQDRHYDWEIADRLETVPLRVVDCDDSGALAVERERFFEHSPSLAAAPPFMVLLAHGADGDSLVLNLHHAAGDGVSAARLMLSVLRAYAGAGDPAPAPDPLAIHDVRELSAARSPDERSARGRALIRGAWRPFVPIARVAPEGAQDRGAYGFELIGLSATESRFVFARFPPGLTVNDVLLAALAVAIWRWNTEHGQAERLIALTMPVNLRPTEWRTEVVSNFASWATVWVEPWDGEGLGAVIERVGERTDEIKRDRLGGLAVDLLEVPSRLRIAGKRWLQYMKALTGEVVVDTASMSDLGRLERLPQEIEEAASAVWFSPPGQMPLGVSIGAVTLGDRLCMTLRYRHAQFDRPAAARFAALLRDVLLG